MTVGNKTFGDNSTTGYYQKSWSGTNGPYSGITPTVWHSYGVAIDQSIQVMGKSRYPNHVTNYQGVDPWTANDELALLDKLSSAVKGHQFNLAVALGQGRETAALTVGTLYRLASAVRAIKKGRVDLALRSLGATARKGRPLVYNHRKLTSKDVSSMWLEIQYGWRPLIQDVYEAQKAFAVSADRMRKSTFEVSHANSGHWTGMVNGGNVRCVQSKDSSKRLRAELYELPSTARSLGLTDPAAVLWELTPFSFVADWFIPIGRYLDVLNTIPKLSGRFLTMYRRVTHTQQTGTAPGSFQGFIGASSSGLRIQFDRSAGTTLSVPKPQFIPIGDALSTGRIKNGIALLHQLLVEPDPGWIIPGRHHSFVSK